MYLVKDYHSWVNGLSQIEVVSEALRPNDHEGSGLGSGTFKEVFVERYMVLALLRNWPYPVGFEVCILLYLRPPDMPRLGGTDHQDRPRAGQRCKQRPQCLP